MGTEQNATLEFACGRCETRLNVKPFLAGKKINCPKCHKKVVVPKQNGGIAVVPDGTNLKISDAVKARKRHDAANTPTRTKTRSRAGSEGTADQEMLRAENKALRERLEKRKHEPPALSEDDRDALAAARKRIAELELQLSQARTEAEGARARAAAAIRDRKDKS